MTRIFQRGMTLGLQRNTIVHFAGYGRQKGIYLLDKDGKSKLARTEAVANLFRLFKDNLQCVFLNSCYSEHQAKVIKEHVPYVIGMNHSIHDDDAILFSSFFYRAIADGKTIPRAFETGIARIKFEENESEDIPVLLS